MLALQHQLCQANETAVIGIFTVVLSDLSNPGYF
jgi:hypothetical protein